MPKEKTMLSNEKRLLEEGWEHISGSLYLYLRCSKRRPEYYPSELTVFKCTFTDYQVGMHKLVMNKRFTISLTPSVRTNGP